MLRQGDVLLVPVEVEMPKGVLPCKEVILAEGEMTGHAHRLAAPAVYEWESDGQRYVQVQGAAPGEISHEEHDTTPAAVITPGVTYRVVRQQEWDLSGQWRKVRD